MHSRVVMTASAVYLIGVGIVLNFLPQEVAATLGLAGSPAGALLLQMIAALYLGLGIVNWMWRDNVVGGIYGRPVGVGNVAHFMVGALGLGRAVFDGWLPTVIWPVAALYVLFGIAFAWLVFFNNPSAPGGPLS